MLALLGAATAQAYDFPKVNSPYHCRWERYNQTTGQLINKGVSLVTFTNVTNTVEWNCSNGVRQWCYQP